MRPAVKVPVETGLPNPEQIVKPDAYAKSGGSVLVWPDGKSRAGAVNSVAPLPENGQECPVGVAQQIGCRTPRLTGFDAALNSGLWVAAVGRDSVATVTGGIPTCGEDYARPDSRVVKGTRVMKNTATLSQVFKWQFG